MPFKHFFAIIRPLNCAMAGLGTFIGYSIASGAIQFSKGIGIAMLVAFLVCGGGMVINDYFDKDVDKKRHPEKPIPSGRISPIAALLYSKALFLAGNVLAFYFLPATAFAIAFAFTLLLILYSRILSKAKWLGNWVVASGTAFTLLFGASLVSSYTVVAVLAVSALFANLARELIKDLEDKGADKGFKRSLPMLIGEKKVKALILVYYLIAIVSVYIPVVLLSFGNVAFIALVSIANFGFLYSSWQARHGNFAKGQVFSKAAMVLALIGFLVGAI